MARPHDPENKERILNACANVAIKNGLNLTLNEFSKKTQISSRMLIFHFGSKEDLLSETMLRCRKILREKIGYKLGPTKNTDLRELVKEIWIDDTTKEMHLFIRAFFVIYTESVSIGEVKPSNFAYENVEGWISWAKKAFAHTQPVLNDTELRLVLAVLRGLLLEYLATRNLKKTTHTLETFLNNYSFESEKH